VTEGAASLPPEVRAALGDDASVARRLAALERVAGTSEGVVFQAFRIPGKSLLDSSGEHRLLALAQDCMWLERDSTDGEPAFEPIRYANVAGVTVAGLQLTVAAGGTAQQLMGTSLEHAEALAGAIADRARLGVDDFRPAAGSDSATQLRDLANLRAPELSEAVVRLAPLGEGELPLDLARVRIGRPASFGLGGRDSLALATDRRLLVADVEPSAESPSEIPYAGLSFVDVRREWFYGSTVLLVGGNSVHELRAVYPKERAASLCELIAEHGGPARGAFRWRADQTRAEQLPELAQAKIGRAPRELELLAGDLDADEQVATVALGEYAGVDGLVLATDRRILFLSGGSSGLRTRHELRYDAIDSVYAERSFGTRALVALAAGTPTRVRLIQPKARAEELASTVLSKLPSAAERRARADGAKAEPVADRASAEVGRGAFVPWLKENVLAAVTIAALIVFGLQQIMYQQFYGRLGIAPDEAGVSFSEAAASAALVTFALVVVGAVVVLLVGVSALALLLSAVLPVVVVVGVVSYLAVLVGVIVGGFGLIGALALSRFSEALAMGLIFVSNAVMFVPRWLARVWRGAARIAVWSRRARARRRLALAAMTLVLATAVCLLGYLTFAARERARSAAHGRPEGSISLLGVPILKLQAEYVLPDWLDEPPAGFETVSRRCLVYLGRADGTVVLYDPITKGTLRVPSGSVALDHGACYARAVEPARFSEPRHSGRRTERVATPWGSGRWGG
jgi:PH (Pleckstrin Homology) domain-containing protein